MGLTIYLLGLFILLISTWIWDRKRRQCRFRNYGIDGPTPNLLLGNFNIKKEKGMKGAIQEWTDGRYGSTVCYYKGDVPTILSSDVELIKEVFIKQFQIFSDRKATIPVAMAPDKYNPIAWAKYHDWRRIRNIMSPAFSAIRMKEMSPVVNVCVDRFLQNISKNGNKPIDFYNELQQLTVDAITTCAFGFETNVQSSENKTFLEMCKDAFNTADTSPPAIYKFLFLFTALNERLATFCARYMHRFMPKPVYQGWFDAVVEEIVGIRRTSQEHRIDFLHHMMNSTETDMELSKLEVNTDDDLRELTTNHQNGSTVKAVETSGKKLTVAEMKGQCMAFFLAGYETTSTALALLVHQLAKNPGVQKKLQKELDEYYPDKTKCRPDYYDVQKLKYLDMVISENLRFHIIAEIGRIRECTESTSIMGIPFQKGDCFQPAIYALHHDPEHWGPEPVDQFVPERFLPERVQSRHPCAFIPFGSGPRNCIGMRFSLLEQKVAVARLFREFWLEPCAQTPDIVKTRVNVLYSPVQAIYLKATKRS